MAVYSHSRLACYENCPLQYKLRYLDRIKAERDTIEAFLGSRFHEVMEKLYGDSAVRATPLAELLAYFEARWAAEIHAGVEIHEPDRTSDDYRRLGRRFIEDYYARYRPFDQSRVLGLEKRVLTDLDGTGRYRVQGYIDRLAKTSDGAYEIHDYKTSASLPRQSDLDEDRQLALYQIAVQEMWRDVRSVRLVWHYVAFDEEMSSVRNPEQLEGLKRDIIGLIVRIESAAAFEPRESALCDWCPYGEHCPVKKHPARVGALEPEMFAADDGVRIVDAFAEATARRRARQAEADAVEAEIDRIKAAAVAFARREGLEVIRGTCHRLRVKSGERVKPPAKGSPERRALEEALQAAGVWANLSTLDAFALERAVKAGLAPGLKERVEAWLVREKETQVSLSKLKDGD